MFFFFFVIIIGTPTIQSTLCPVKNIVPKKRLSLLKNIGIRIVADLTPKKKILYTVAKKMMKKVDTMTKKNYSLKTQIKLAKICVTTDSCNNLVNKLNKTTLNFIKSQVNSKKEFKKQKVHFRW